MDEQFLALGARSEISLRLVPQSTPKIRIASKEGVTDCRASPEVVGLWWRLRELVVDDSPERSQDLSLDPKRYVKGQTVALAKRPQEAGYEIWYVENIDRLNGAAEILSSILDQCGATVTFELYPTVVYPGND